MLSEIIQSLNFVHRWRRARNMQFQLFCYLAMPAPPVTSGMRQTNFKTNCNVGFQVKIRVVFNFIIVLCLAFGAQNFWSPYVAILLNEIEVRKER